MKKQTVALIETEVGRTILFCDVFEDAATAYGRAMLEVDAYMADSKSNYHFTSIFRLEADAGFGFDAIDETDETGNLRVLILDAMGEDANNE